MGAVCTAPFPVVKEAIIASWSVETCDPTDAALWSELNPARGQCVASAFLLHDLFGGDLLEAKVTGADGSAQGFHYWNRLPEQGEVDLTIGQFVDGECLGEPIVFLRPPGPPSHGVSQYRVLEERVRSVLARMPSLGEAVTA